MKESNLSLDSLSPLFNSLEQLTKVQRIAIYIGSMVLVGVAFFYLSFYPKQQTIKGLEASLASAKQALAKAKRNASQLNYYRNKMKQEEAQFKAVMKALPEKEEIPSLLAGISKAGKDAGLEFILFQPKKEIPKGFYAEIPVGIEVSGGYHQVAVFFDKVANLPRIVTIKNITMVPTKSKGVNTLNTKCMAVTYKFIEKKAGKKAGKKGRRK